MLQTNFFIPTLRENPKEAEVISHILLLRSGMMRQIASGIYTILPLGYRVLKKIIAIVEEEMNAIGANALIFPLAQPAELWIESGRWNIYGKELFRFKDRLERNFALAPTHEEVCTSIISNGVHSYKQLPLTVYQIHWKFRDEARPRYGLLRGREFLMKDGYSFHSSFQDLEKIYNIMYKAYSRIFSRLGLHYVAVEADTGSIGGSASHEFMALADIGEDTIISCPQCLYSANLEKAVSSPSLFEVEHSSLECSIVLTPNVESIESLANFCSVSEKEIVKSMAYIADNTIPVLVCLRGDKTVNENKVKAHLKADILESATKEQVETLFHSCVGFLGPYQLNSNIVCIVDDEILDSSPYIIGSNSKDKHCSNFVFERDCLTNYTKVDVRNVEKGDHCYKCESSLELQRGIEIGHIFKLGTKYSEAMKGYFSNEQGTLEPFIMGCYGIGVSRLLSAVIEQSHDDKGIIFPLSIAPFHCIIVLLDADEKLELLAKELYTFLQGHCEVLFDDRKERAGVKLNDADLIGIPLQIIVGKKGYSNGVVECKIRSTGERFTVPFAQFEDSFIKEIENVYPEFIAYYNK